MCVCVYTCSVILYTITLIILILKILFSLSNLSFIHIHRKHFDLSRRSYTALEYKHDHLYYSKTCLNKNLLRTIFCVANRQVFSLYRLN